MKFYIIDKYTKGCDSLYVKSVEIHDIFQIHFAGSDLDSK